MDRERVVELEHEGRRFTFRVDRDPPLAFWRVECDGKSYITPVRYRGDEAPGFFLSLALTAITDHEF